MDTIDKLIDELIEDVTRGGHCCGHPILSMYYQEKNESTMDYYKRIAPEGCTFQKFVVVYKRYPIVDKVKKDEKTLT